MLQLRRELTRKDGESNKISDIRNCSITRPGPVLEDIISSLKLQQWPLDVSASHKMEEVEIKVRESANSYAH